MTTEYQISEERQRYGFVMIPNIVDDMGLSPYAYRLYGHLKRVTGESGECYQSGETIAKACNISTGAVSKAKQELKEKGLIRIEIKANDRNIYHNITIVDIWELNRKHSPSRGEGGSQSEGGIPDEKLPSPDEKLPSRGETKKNPVKNTPTKKNPESAAKPQRTRDERLDHPAIKLIRGVTGRYPPKSVFNLAIQKLGNQPDGVKFANVHEVWCARGKNPTNLEGQFDWYTDGIPDYRNGTGKSNGKSTLSDVFAAIDAA